MEEGRRHNKGHREEDIDATPETLSKAIQQNKVIAPLSEASVQTREFHKNAAQSVAKQIISQRKPYIETELMSHGVKDFRPKTM